jgi:hypothetical protein
MGVMWMGVMWIGVMWIGVMWSTATQTKGLRQTQLEFTIYQKLNSKIICNALGKNPFGQTCREHVVSDCLRLNFLIVLGFPGRDRAG